MKWLAAILVFLCVNGVDYKNLGDRFDDGKIRWAMFASVPTAFLYLRKKLHWAPAFIAALSLFSYTWHDYKASHDTVLPVVQIFACLGTAIFALHLGETVIRNVLIASGVFQSAVVYLHAAGIFPFFHPLPPGAGWNMTVGTIGQSTVLGPLLVCALAAALYSKAWVWSAVMLPAIALVNSTLTYACLVGLGLFYLAGFYGPFVIGLLPVLAASLLGLYYFFPDMTLPHGKPLFHADGRLFMWSYGVSAIKENLWFGSGIGAWEQTYLPRYAGSILQVFGFHLPKALHNDYLDFIVEYGLVPFLVILGALVEFILSLRPTWHHAVCLILLIDALGSFPASQMFLAMIFVVSWSLSLQQPEGVFA